MRYRIVNIGGGTDHGLYWGGDNGWGSVEDAAEFTDDDKLRFNLPADSVWAPIKGSEEVRQPHTPGPWVWVEQHAHYSNAALLIWTSKGPGHGCVAEASSLPGYDVAKANARLIAKAPEMAQLLMQALGRLSATRRSGHGGLELIRKINHVLRQAGFAPHRDGD